MPRFLRLARLFISRRSKVQREIFPFLIATLIAGGLLLCAIRGFLLDRRQYLVSSS